MSAALTMMPVPVGDCHVIAKGRVRLVESTGKIRRVGGRMRVLIHRCSITGFAWIDLNDLYLTRTAAFAALHGRSTNTRRP